MKNILTVLILLLVCSSVFAAKEITQEYTTGQTLYAVIANDSLQIWNGTAFDTTPTTGEWGNYDIAMTEDTVLLGVYYADWPATLTTAGRYRVRVYVGTSPAYTDTVVGSDFYNWSGTAETTLGYVATILDSTYLNVGGIGSIVDDVKAKTDLLNFTGTGEAAKVNSQIKATDDIAFSATQLTSIANAFVSDDAEAIRDLILGGDKTPITMVGGKARAVVGAVAN